MNNVKNEHYIPRFYLKRFSTGRIKSAYVIDVYNKKTHKKLLKQNVKNFACINKFYDIDNNEIREQLDILFKFPNISNDDKIRILNDRQLIEHYFANVENQIKPLFDLIEVNHDIINDIFFRANFCIFIRDLSIRTNGFREHMTKIASTSLEQLRKLKIEKIGNFDISKSADELAKVKQLQAIASIPLLVKDATILLTEYNFYIGINNTKIPFIISDQPALPVFVKCNEICIPISSKTAIIMRAKGKNAKYLTDIIPLDYEIELTEKNVIYYNIVQFSTASEYLFGNIKEIERMIKLQKFSDTIHSLDDNSLHNEDFYVN